jgi:hypothetical protein
MKRRLYTRALSVERGTMMNFKRLTIGVFEKTAFWKKDELVFLHEVELPRAEVPPTEEKFLELHQKAMMHGLNHLDSLHSREKAQEKQRKEHEDLFDAANKITVKGAYS